MGHLSCPASGRHPLPRSINVAHAVFIANTPRPPVVAFSNEVSDSPPAATHKHHVAAFDLDDRDLHVVCQRDGRISGPARLCSHSVAALRLVIAQNRTFKLICNWRGTPRVVVITPKLGALTVEFGCPKTGVFVRLNASIRNSIVNRSATGNRRNNEKSRSLVACVRRAFRPRLPNV
jgi:hypothetical protein